MPTGCVYDLAAYRIRPRGSHCVCCMRCCLVATGSAQQCSLPNGRYLKTYGHKKHTSMKLRINFCHQRLQIVTQRGRPLKKMSLSLVHFADAQACTSMSSIHTYTCANIDWHVRVNAHGSTHISNHTSLQSSLELYGMCGNMCVNMCIDTSLCPTSLTGMNFGCPPRVCMHVHRHACLDICRHLAFG